VEGGEAGGPPPGCKTATSLRPRRGRSVDHRLVTTLAHRHLDELTHRYTVEPLGRNESPVARRRDQPASELPITPRKQLDRARLCAAVNADDEADARLAVRRADVSRG
jgi:hypothetical protein